MGTLRLRFAWLAGVWMALMTFAVGKLATEPGFEPNVTGHVVHAGDHPRVAGTLDGHAFVVHLSAPLQRVEVGEAIELECQARTGSDVPECRVSPFRALLLAIGLAAISWPITLWLWLPMISGPRRVPRGASKP